MKKWSTVLKTIKRPEKKQKIHEIADANKNRYATEAIGSTDPN